MKESMPISEQRLFAAVPTFFDSRDEFPLKEAWEDTPMDEKTIREHINRIVMHGISPLIIGTTGESPTLTHDDEKRLIEIARDEIDNNTDDSRVPLLVGAGSNCTREAVKYTQSAVDGGADGLLHVFPYYNKPNERGQELHYSSVLKAAGPASVVAYNIPGRTGGKGISYHTVIRLANHFPNFDGVKECNAEQMQKPVTAAYSERVKGSPFRVWTGEDPNIVENMQNGVFGAISVLANVDPAGTREMIELCATGNFELAAIMHDRRKRLIELLFKEGNPIGVKGALYLQHVGNNEARLPIVGASSALLDELHTEMEDLDLLDVK